MSFDAIPDELRALDRWVVWRWEPDPEKPDKPKKPPYPVHAIGGDTHASNRKPADWAPFDQAVTAVRSGRANGIGLALEPPYVGVDLDEELSEADQAAIILALNSYTESSPSGAGHHVIVRADLNGHGRHPKGIGVFTEARFFYCTGEHLRGTPTTIEERQAQLDEVLARFLPKNLSTAVEKLPPQPVDLDDQELLDRMFASKHGHVIQALWEGDTSAHGGDQSAADAALLAWLAWWTHSDPARMEAMFSNSVLGQRDKWTERADYRERTIQFALDGCHGGYEPQVRPPRDAVGTHPAFAPEAGVESAGAALRPDVVGTQDGPHPPKPRSVNEPAPLVIVEAKAFADVNEASAKPLLGSKGDTVLAAGGSAVWYGDGGAGKTTLGLDQAIHLATGTDWLGLEVPTACRVLWIENEGPRGMFREKLRAKLAAWEGDPLDGHLQVLEQPWSLFTFRNERHRSELVALIESHGIDVVFAGPVQRLGVEGGGTPSEIQAFVDLLELVRADLARPLAYELIHHENKSGAVSGAWEGATDTLAHVQARGNGHTAIVWDKVRWASEIHGRTWKLNWGPGESFEVDDTPETTDDEIADQLLGLVREAPGKSWNSYDGLLKGKGKRKRLVRDQLLDLEDGRLLNVGTAKSMRLFLPGQVDTLPVDEVA